MPEAKAHSASLNAAALVCGLKLQFKFGNKWKSNCLGILFPQKCFFAWKYFFLDVSGFFKRPRLKIKKKRKKFGEKLIEMEKEREGDDSQLSKRDEGFQTLLMIARLPLAPWEFLVGNPQFPMIPVFCCEIVSFCRSRLPACFPNALSSLPCLWSFYSVHFLLYFYTSDFNSCV